jgi:hypothetical protein
MSNMLAVNTPPSVVEEVDETQQRIDRLAKERREQQIASRRGVRSARQAVR